MKARDLIAALTRGIEESGDDDIECQCCNYAGDLDYISGVALFGKTLVVSTDHEDYAE